jgi:hypothetical protein
VTARQKQLIRAYARSDNVYEAAAAAFYTTKHIRSVLRALLESDEGQAIYHAEKERTNGTAIPAALPPDLTDAPPEEIKAELTRYYASVMRSEAVSTAQRTRAAEGLARLNRLFAEPPEPPIEAPVIVDFPNEEEN